MRATMYLCVWAGGGAIPGDDNDYIYSYNVNPDANIVTETTLLT